MLLTIIQANNTYQTTTHLTSLLSLAWSNQRLQLCFQFVRMPQGKSLIITSPRLQLWTDIKGRRGSGRDGDSVFLRLHSFSGGCTLDFLSLLCSHSGAGSLTAAVTELDGFDLLWLEKTFMPRTHTQMTLNAHILYICTDNTAPCSRRYLHYMQMLNTMTHFTFIYVHTEHTFHNHICLTHTCF